MEEDGELVAVYTMQRDEAMNVKGSGGQTGLGRLSVKAGVSGPSMRELT